MGKSSLLMRFADDKFTECHLLTIGLDFRIKTFEMDDGLRVKLQIWDTAGEERFRTITSSYYRGAHGIVLVIDLTRSETLRNVPKWVAEVEKHVRGPVSQLMVGNKLDSSERVVTTEEAFSVANSFRKSPFTLTVKLQIFICLEIPYLETSAKASTNVEQMFFMMVTEMKNRLEHTKTAISLSESEGAIKLEKRTTVTVAAKNGCCYL